MGKKFPWEFPGHIWLCHVKKVQSLDIADFVYSVVDFCLENEDLSRSIPVGFLITSSLELGNTSC